MHRQRIQESISSLFDAERQGIAIEHVAEMRKAHEQEFAFQSSKAAQSILHGRCCQLLAAGNSAHTLTVLVPNFNSAFLLWELGEGVREEGCTASASSKPHPIAPAFLPPQTPCSLVLQKDRFQSTAVEDQQQEEDLQASSVDDAAAEALARENQELHQHISRLSNDLQRFVQ